MISVADMRKAEDSAKRVYIAAIDYINPHITGRTY